MVLALFVGLWRSKNQKKLLFVVVFATGLSLFAISIKQKNYLQKIPALQNYSVVTRAWDQAKGEIYLGTGRILEPYSE